MSVREKDLRNALRRASSEKNSTIKYRKIGECMSRYLKSRFSDNAIALAERTVLNKRDEYGEIPDGLGGAFIEAARYYSRNGNFDRAEELLKEISDSRNVTICLQARYELDLIRIKRQLDQGTIDEEAIEDIKTVVQDDEEHELETSTAGKFSDYDFFRSYFGERIPINDLNEEIFPAVMKKPTKTRRPSHPDGDPGDPSNYSYDEKLSANNRLKFLVENFPIASGSPGDGKFQGAILFEIEGSDLVIVENFWKKTRTGEIVEDYGKATYILPKDQAMDLIKLSRGQLAGKNDPRIVSVRHGSKEYYNNLIERFNAAQSAELQKIEQKNNPLENAETKTRKTAEGIEKFQDTEEHIYDATSDTELSDTTIDDNIENNETASDSNSKKESTKRDFYAENREFLSEINTNIGEIITPEIMEGLLKRASYSFRDLYESKLKDEILGRLEILEVPDENKDIEAQKVFLYLRMAKNISMINSGAINGENLDKVLDDTTVEYENGFEFFERHIGDGLSYKDLKKYMKIYVETGIDPLAQPQASQDKELNDVIDPPKDSAASVQYIQQEDNLASNDSVDTKKMEVLDFAARYTELLEKLARIEAESKRLDIKFAEKEQSYSEKQQATIEAKEAEERAKLATIEATEQEEKSRQELEDLKLEREKLEQDKKAIEEKKAIIDSLLGGDGR